MAGAVTNLLLAGSLLLALVYAILNRGSWWVFRLPSKAGSVLLIALVALHEQGSWLLVLALVLSAIGDGALVFPGRPAFLAGLLAFLLAHLAFAVCIVLAPAWDLQSGDPWQWVLILTLGACAVALVAAVWEGADGMRLPAMAYAAVILFMVGCAVLSADMVLIAGALLFFASDAVLALEAFRIAKTDPIRRISVPFIWWTYYFAQLLLAYGLLMWGRA